MVTYIKGGVWTNVEDEILRAAVAKYGLNQWARVSSLLVRKTAKQVKARWTEWLDPAIRKVEWSREEDEKLLHLAKLMPTQWRSIAPLVGRTASQCIERYQKLLDDAERREQKTDLSLSGVGDEAAAPVSGSSSRTYRLGDIDPHPETRPARPDAVDMDEDEKEMLSEARARLANTKGKKAKRKDRERLLDESRRLTLLQKRRELKQAGVNTKLRPKMKGSINYNNDVPFEHKPAPGFYDTAEEKEANERAKARYAALLEKKGIQSGNKDGNKDGGKRDRDDTSSGGTAAQQAAAARAEKLLQITESEQIAKRRKLVLPEPQVRDDELEQIIKHARRGDDAKQLNEADSSTSGLVGEYGEILPERSINGALETPLADDRIRQAMTDLKSLTDSQSSLLGGENTPLNDDSFRHGTMLPPPVAAQRNAVLKHIDQTPRRDALGVNIAGVEATPKSQLRRGFASLPKPRNDFEIAIPEEEAFELKEEEEETLVDDAGERERALAAEKERQRLRMLERRSQVLKKGLPRPPSQMVGGLNKMAIEQPFHKLILEEMKVLLKSDSIKWPSADGPTNGHGKEASFVVSDLSDEERSRALAKIRQEAGDFDATAAVVTELHEPSSMDSKLVMNVLTTFAQKSNKQEQKLGLVLGGYMKRQSILSDKLSQALTALEEIQSQRLAFEHLRDMEEIALSSRLSRLQEEVNFLVDAERKGQDRYRELKSLS